MYLRCTLGNSIVPKMYLEYFILFEVSFLYLTHALIIHVPKMYLGASDVPYVPNVYQ